MKTRIKIRNLFVALVVTFVFLVSVAPIHATPITFSFVTQLPVGTTYGSGSLTFDNSLLVSPFPKTITQGNLTGFSYVDPTAGSFGLGNLLSLSLTFVSATTPSSFSFLASSMSGLIFGDSGGGTVSVGFTGPGGGVASPNLLLPTSGIPEPSSLLLLGTGLVGIAALRKFRRL